MSPPRSEDESRSRNLRSGTGITLIAIGILGILWIVERILTLSAGPQAVGFIASFAALDADGGRILRTPQGDLELPAGSYLVAGTFLYVLVLAIAAGIAKALVAAGARLLSHDVAALLDELRADMKGLRAYLEGKAAEMRARR